MFYVLDEKKRAGRLIHSVVGPTHSIGMVSGIEKGLGSGQSIPSTL